MQKHKLKKLGTYGTMKNALICSLFYIFLDLYSEYEFWTRGHNTYSYIIMWVSVTALNVSFVLYILTVINDMKDKMLSEKRKKLRIVIIIILLICVLYLPQKLSDTLFGGIVTD